MNRIVIQEGYTLPFAGASRRKRRPARRARRSGRRMPGAVKRQQGKMKACAKKWNAHGTGKYTSFMKKCLKGG